MTKFVIEREHELSLDECRELSKSLADSLIDSYGGTKKVGINEVHYKHVSGSTGLLSFDDASLKVEVKLSFMMMSLKSVLKKEIIFQCDKRLS